MYLPVWNINLFIYLFCELNFKKIAAQINEITDGDWLTEKKIWKLSELSQEIAKQWNF